MSRFYTKKTFEQLKYKRVAHLDHFGPVLLGGPHHASLVLLIGLVDVGVVAEEDGDGLDVSVARGRDEWSAHLGIFQLDIGSPARSCTTELAGRVSTVASRRVASDTDSSTRLSDNLLLLYFLCEPQIVSQL